MRDPFGSAGEKGTRGATALSPPPGPAGGLVLPGYEGKTAGHRAGPPACGSRSSPHSGVSSRPGCASPPSQLPAALLRSRDPVLLVSVGALPARIPPADGANGIDRQSRIARRVLRAAGLSRRGPALRQRSGVGAVGGGLFSAHTT